MLSVNKDLPFVAKIRVRFAGGDAPVTVKRRDVNASSLLKKHIV
jgi:hypothetical protein